jgi:hypothetical protein
MGITNPLKKVGPSQVSAVTMDEEFDEEVPNTIKKRVINTSDNLIEPVDLMLIPVMILNEVMDVRVDPGALVSVIPLQLVQRLDLVDKMSPSDESLKFAGGQVERVIGEIELSLLLSEDLEIAHTFLVADNVYMPFLLGLDFLLSKGGEILHKDQVLRFIFSEDDIIDIAMLIDLKTKDDPAYIPSVSALMKVKTESLLETQGFDINPSLPLEQRKSILQAVLPYKECFAHSIEDIQVIDDIPVKIDLVEDAVPWKTQPYRLSRDQELWLKSYLQRLLEADLIEPSQSSWAAGVVLVPSDVDKRRTRKRSVRRPSRAPVFKSQYMNGKVVGSIEPFVEGDIDWDTSYYETEVVPPSFTLTTVAPEVHGPLAATKDPYRVCIDYRPLNRQMKKKAYPVPKISHLLTSLSGSTWFSSFDALKGYWQRMLAEEDRPKTAFTTIYGLYQWKRLPMGLHSAVAEWQSSMDQIFSEYLHDIMEIYIDDGIIHSNCFKDHLKHITLILSKVSSVGLTLSLSKCKFGYFELPILGYLVGASGIRSNPRKTSNIVNWPIPSDATSLRRFIGLLQFYRRFIKDSSELIGPMVNRLSKRNAPFTWTIEANNAFIICKWILTNAPVLSLPDFNKAFILATDASNHAIGAVLSQPVDDDLSLSVVVEYGSRVLEDAKTRYSTYDREFLAVVYFIHYWRPYLLGKHFYLYTDHYALKYVLTNPDPPGRIIRWLIKLQDYDFTIIYKKGKLNTNADALSRLSQPLSVEMITRLPTQENSEGPGLSDMEYQNILTYLSSLMYPTDATEAERKHIQRSAKKYSIFRDLILRKNPTQRFPYHRPVPLRRQIPGVIQDNHDHWTAGHQGIRLTFKKISQSFYWPRYYEDVKEYVLSCDVCQAFGPKTPPVPLNPLTVPKGILQEMMMDYMAMPMTPSGNACILVGIDLFTHWVELKAFPTEDAENAILFLFDWISQYGVPERVISDRGPHFDNALVTGFLQNYDLKLTIGTPYHPHRTGQVERTVQSVRNIVSKMAHSLGEHWDVWLPAVAYVLRVSPFLPHGISPFFLLYGRQPRMISNHIELTTEVDELDVESEESLLAFLDQVADRSTNATGYYTNLLEQKKTMIKRDYDKKTKVTQYKKGDTVMVTNDSISKLSNKLVPHWFGPYLVDKIYGNDAYQIKDQELVFPRLYHANQMRLYRPRPRIFPKYRLIY